MKHISKLLIMLTGLLALLTLFQEKALAQNNSMSVPLTPVCKWVIDTVTAPICEFDTLHIYAIQMLQPGCPACGIDHSSSYPQYYKIYGSGGPINNNYSNPYTWIDPYQQILCNGQGEKIPPPLNPGTYTIYTSQDPNFNTIVDQKTIIVYGEESVNFNSSYNLNSYCDGLLVNVNLINPMPNTLISVYLHAPNPLLDDWKSQYNSFNYNFDINMWGTYIIETEISNSCYDTIHYDTINIPGPFFTTTGFDCPSNAISFYGNSVNCFDQILHWHWDFGDGSPNSNIQNPTHPYQNSGTYTVTLIVSGADPLYQADTITQQVTVYPSPAVQHFTGYFNTCHGNTNYTIDPASFNLTNFSYYYSIGFNGTHHAITSNPFNVNWTSSGGGVLYVNVTDNTTNCSSQDSLKVFACCKYHKPGDPPYPQYNDTTFTSAPGATVFDLNGTLTINGTFSFNTNTIYLGPNAKIVVNPSRTLTLTTTYLQAGCDTMWDGIYLNGTSSQISVNNSNINDAKSAIVSSNGGNFQLSNTVSMGNNYRNIVIHSYAGTHPGKISKTTFISNTLKHQYPPITATRTLSGVEIDSVYKIIIGDTSSISKRNTFQNMEYGILFNPTNVLNNLSNVFIYNNKFVDINAPSMVLYPPTPPQGTAIGILGEKATTYATVGGINASGYIRSNYFSNCYYGIFFNGNLNTIKAEYDTLVMQTYALTVPRGISAYGSSINNATFRYNKVTNGAFGILYVDLSINSINISSNTIEKASTGIAVTNVVPAIPYNFQIANNTINYPIAYTATTTGILVTNISGTNHGGVKPLAFISTNHVTFTVPSLNFMAYGIRVQNCPLTHIEQNTILNSSATVPTTQAQALKFNGIEDEISASSYLCLNIITKLGCGLRFYGSMTGSNASVNTMTSTYYGVRLDTAIIGDQGTSVQANGNLWNTNTAYKVQGSISGGALNWYYTGAYSSGNPLCPFPFSVSGTFNTPTSLASATACRLMTPQLLINGLEPIVNNTNTYSMLAAENAYTDQKMAYSVLNDDVSLRQLMLSAVPATGLFYTSKQNGNIGKFKQVNDLMQSSNYATAETLNNSLIPENAMEADCKMVNSIYMQTWAKGIFTFTNDDYQTLKDIAENSPILFGDAVYSARVMVGEAPANINSLKKVNAPEQPLTSYFGKAFPNPANSTINLNYKISEGQKATLAVFNLMGQLIEKVDLTSDKTSVTLSTNNFIQGLYFLNISLNGEIISNDKVVIIK